MAYISQQDLQGIFQKADATGQKLNREEIVQELVNRGNEIEGLNAPKVKKGGFFSGIAQSAGERIGQQKDTLGRLATGQQGFRDTFTQMAGQAAGFAGDVIGQGVMKVAGAITPEPVKASLKQDALAILNTPIGQAGLKAAQSGMDLYSDWKEEHPRDAANLEAVVNLAGFLPLGAGAKVAAQPVRRGFVGASRALGTALEPTEKLLRESAERGVKQVLGATTKQAKMQSERLAPEILKRPLSETLAVTRKGMQGKAEAGLARAGQKMDDFGALEGKTKLRTVIDALEAEKGQFAVDGVAVNPQAIENITKMQELFMQYGDEMPTESLRNVRKLLDQAVYGAKGSFPTVQEGSKLSAQKLAADKIRGILADANPDLAKLNKEYTFWKNLDEVLAATNLRQGSQTKGLVKNVATVIGAGSAAEPAAMATRALLFRGIASVVGSPTWKLVTAKTKSKLADAIAASRFTDAAKILENTTPEMKMIREAIEDVTKNAATRNRSILQIPDTGDIGRQLNREIALPNTLPDSPPPVNMVDDALPLAPPPSAGGAAGAQQLNSTPLSGTIEDMTKTKPQSPSPLLQEARKATPAKSNDMLEGLMSKPRTGLSEKTTDQLLAMRKKAKGSTETRSIDAELSARGYYKEQSILQYMDNMKDMDASALKNAIKVFKETDEVGLATNIEAAERLLGKPTWKEFTKGKMGPYMKSEGSHGAAMKRMSREFKELQSQ